MNIVPHDHDFGREQAIKASFQPLDIPTDWDAVIRSAASLNPEEMIAELRAGEPYDDNELNKLKVWRLNTRIRIAHRYRRGLPQHHEHTCASCGSRPSAPVVTSDYHVGQCLYCEELPLLHPVGRSRWSHLQSTIFACWDSASNTWGIAWAREDGQHNKSAGVFAVGFNSYWDAYMNVIAPYRFATIFNRACPAGQEIDGSSLISASELFRLSLPLTPDRWQAYCRDQMRKATPEHEEPYQYEIRHACEDFFKKSHH